MKSTETFERWNISETSWIHHIRTD